MERLKTILITVLTLVFVGFGVVASGDSVRASTLNAVQTAYEQQNVMEDLTGSVVNEREFDLSDYPYNASGSPQLISFIEFCYSYTSEKQGDYGLYIYVYNPARLEFDLTSTYNSIQMRTGGDQSASFLNNYKLKYLNSGEDGLFLKFKIDLTSVQRQGILSRVQSTERIYEVSGFELMLGSEIEEYSVEVTYKYTGYVEGYAPTTEQDGTLNCESDGLLTLSLDVHSTAYRPEGSNGKNAFTQDSLHSVYFAVPNEIIEKYGEMVQIHAKWLNATLKPGLVTGNREVYEELLPIAQKNISFSSLEDKGLDWQYEYLGGVDEVFIPNAGFFPYYGYGLFGNKIRDYDNAHKSDEIYGEDLDELPILLYATNGNADISKFESTEELLNYVKNYLSVYQSKRTRASSTESQEVQEFKTAVEAIPIGGNLTTELQAIKTAIAAYQKLSDSEKETVAEEFATLQMAITDCVERTNQSVADSEHIALAPFLGYLVAGKYPSLLFSRFDTKYTETWVKADENIQLKSYKVNQTWWGKLLGAGFGWEQEEQPFENLQAIQEVTASDLIGSTDEICKNLAIGRADFDDFKKFYEQNKSDSTVFLFRFYKGDFIAQEATLYKLDKVFPNKKVAVKQDTNAYFFQTDVNLNFDIIDISYDNGIVKTTIPVVMSPIDIIPNPTPPIITTPDFVFWRYGVWIMGALLVVLIIAIIIKKGAKE